MPRPEHEIAPLDDLPYTTLVAPGRKLVHAVSLVNPEKTACGRPYRNGWKLVRRHLGCRKCKQRIFLQVSDPEAR